MLVWVENYLKNELIKWLNPWGYVDQSKPFRETLKMAWPYNQEVVEDSQKLPKTRKFLVKAADEVKNIYSN